MELLRKSLKAYLMTLIFFVLLTLLLAVLIRFTGFSESWAFAGLIAVLSLASCFVGFLEGRIVGKRGLVTGAIAALVLMVIVLLSVHGVFTGSFGITGIEWSYIIPLCAGGAGGIMGVSGAA